MAIYKAETRRALSRITPEERLSNQIIFTGSSDNSIAVPQGIVFIELLIVDGAGSIEFKDGNGDVIATGVTDFSQDHSPLRCDRGVTMTGDVAIAKGFVIADAFLS